MCARVDSTIAMLRGSIARRFPGGSVRTGVCVRCMWLGWSSSIWASCDGFPFCECPPGRLSFVKTNAPGYECVLLCILRNLDILSGAVSGVVERREMHKVPYKVTEKEGRFPRVLLLLTRRSNSSEITPRFFTWFRLDKFVTSKRKASDSVRQMDQRQFKSRCR